MRKKSIKQIWKSADKELLRNIGIFLSVLLLIALGIHFASSKTIKLTSIVMSAHIENSSGSATVITVNSDRQITIAAIDGETDSTHKSEITQKELTALKRTMAGFKTLEAFYSCSNQTNSTDWSRITLTSELSTYKNFVKATAKGKCTPNRKVATIMKAMYKLQNKYMDDTLGEDSA